MSVTNYTWDVENDSLLMENDVNSIATVAYTNEPDFYGPLLSEERGGQQYCHHYDALGSTTALTNSTGVVTDTFLYDAWGNDVARTGSTPTIYTWTGCWGYQYDALTDSYYVRTRSFQQVSGRWMAVDTIYGFIGISLYLYVGNCPVTRFDASGMAEEIPFPVADNQWWITYKNDPSKLDDCILGYEWVIIQNFKATKPGPWKPVPTHTWQLNTSTANDVLIAKDGKCFKANVEPTSLIDVLKFPTSVTSTHLIAKIDDTLALDEIKGLDGATLCQLTEKVHKKLGFDDGKKPVLKVGTRKPTKSESERMANMRGPFLVMDTTYIFKNPCGKCAVCFDDPCSTNGECKETFEASVGRGNSDDDLKKTKGIGPWSGTKKCSS